MASDGSNFEMLSALIKICSELGCTTRDSLFHVAYSEETGKGLYATKNLKKGQVLFSHQLNGRSLFNLRNVLYFRSTSSSGSESCATTQLNENISKVVKSVLRNKYCNIDDFFGTTIALMLETPFSTSSYMFHYLRWLPLCYPLEDAVDGQELDSPLLWDERDIQSLSNTSVFVSLRRFEMSSQQTFNTIILKSKELNKFLSSIGLVTMNDKWKYFKHCACVVQAYSFTISNTPEKEEEDRSSDEDRDSGSDDESQCSTNTMIPLMDAFNASNKRQNVHLLIDSKKDLLECRTTEFVKQGEELFNTFGVMSAADRVIKYGYMEVEDAYPLVFSLRDIDNALDCTSDKCTYKRSDLCAILPGLYSRVSDGGVMSGCSSSSSSSSKKKRKNESSSYLDVLDGTGRGVVDAMRQVWIQNQLYEEHDFSLHDFEQPSAESNCLFVIDDILLIEEDITKDCGASGDGRLLREGAGAQGGDNKNNENKKSYSADAGDLEQHSIFSFLNSVCDLSSEVSGSKLKRKRRYNNIYPETMALFHMVLKHRWYLLAQSDEEEKAAGSFAATATRRFDLVRDIKSRERRVLSAYLNWSRDWLQDKSIKIFEVLETMKESLCPL